MLVEFLDNPSSRPSGSHPARNVGKGKERARVEMSDINRLVYLEELAKAEAQMRMIAEHVTGIRAKPDD